MVSQLRTKQDLPEDVVSNYASITSRQEKLNPQKKQTQHQPKAENQISQQPFISSP
uniref:Uncharacterized protein n=1 Tax=Manihot esculenta TaxID=3983 RepID=A0A2C9VAB3_MANES